MELATTLLLLGGIASWVGIAWRVRSALKAHPPSKRSPSTLPTLVGFGLVVAGTTVQNWRNSLTFVAFLPLAMYAAFDAGLARSSRQASVAALSD